MTAGMRRTSVFGDVAEMTLELQPRTGSRDVVGCAGNIDPNEFHRLTSVIGFVVLTTCP